MASSGVAGRARHHSGSVDWRRRVILFFTGIANVLSLATRGNIINIVLIIAGGAMMSFVGIGRGSTRATFFGARTVDPANLPGFGRSGPFSSRAAQTGNSLPAD